MIHHPNVHHEPTQEERRAAFVAVCEQRGQSAEQHGDYEQAARWTACAIRMAAHPAPRTPLWRRVAALLRRIRRGFTPRPRTEVADA